MQLPHPRQQLQGPQPHRRSLLSNLPRSTVYTKLNLTSPNHFNEFFIVFFILHLTGPLQPTQSAARLPAGTDTTGILIKFDNQPQTYRILNRPSQSQPYYNRTTSDIELTNSFFYFLLTVHYPGTYPKNIQCGYKFIGELGQRIRLEFRDFDLFYGGAQ